MANQLPKAVVPALVIPLLFRYSRYSVVPALAFVIGTMLVVQGGLEHIPGYRWKHRWNVP